MQAILPRLEGIDVNRLRWGRGAASLQGMRGAGTIGGHARLFLRGAGHAQQSCVHDRTAAADASHRLSLRSGGKTGAKAIAAAEAKAAGLAAAEDAEKQRAAAAERRNTDDAVAAARARYLARKAAAGKGR